MVVYELHDCYACTLIGGKELLKFMRLKSLHCSLLQVEPNFNIQVYFELNIYVYFFSCSSLTGIGADGCPYEAEKDI